MTLPRHFLPWCPQQPAVLYFSVTLFSFHLTTSIQHIHNSQNISHYVSYPLDVQKQIVSSSFNLQDKGSSEWPTDLSKEPHIQWLWIIFFSPPLKYHSSLNPVYLNWRLFFFTSVQTGLETRDIAHQVVFTLYSCWHILSLFPSILLDTGARKTFVNWKLIELISRKVDFFMIIEPLRSWYSLVFRASIYWAI